MSAPSSDISTSWVSITMSPKVLSEGVEYDPKVGEKSLWSV